MRQRLDLFDNLFVRAIFENSRSCVQANCSPGWEPDILYGGRYLGLLPNRKILCLASAASSTNMRGKGRFLFRFNLPVPASLACRRPEPSAAKLQSVITKCILRVPLGNIDTMGIDKLNRVVFTPQDAARTIFAATSDREPQVQSEKGNGCRM
jgi:hypothetical protein